MSVTREEFLGTTQAKSDQANACDFLGGPMVGCITDIQMTGSADQPVSIRIDSHPQPWKPSKTFRRVLAACWADAEPSEWVGRFVVLYCDPEIKWAGEAVGGIAISHLSHIDGRKTVMVNEKRGKKKGITIETYHAEPQAPTQPVFWPEDAFEKQFKNAEPKLISGEKSADEIIGALEKKAPLTEGQKARIRRAKPVETDQIESEPPQLEDDGDPFGMNDPE